MSSLLKICSLLCVPIVGAHDFSQNPGKVGQTGGYESMTKKTHAYWTDKPRHERGTPPYSPPKDWVYNTGGGPIEGKINVHLVPHTHDDTGWQVTVDQYFFQAVYYILDNVIPRLAEDPNRKFIYVETGFFARWWDQQPPRIKDLTKKLVKNKQLEFINGGWCMHDEASPYYVEMVDQTTRGHQFLKANFGDDAIPTGTWQIDPFGHSNTQAWLLGAESGFESMFWGRTDYQDFNLRKNQSRLEWIWQGSQSLGESAQLFAGEIYGGGGGGYGTWIGFDGSNNQIQDDPRLHDYNVDKQVDQFIQYAQSQAAHTATEHQMWACGSDFQYQNADHWYHNLDKLIHYVNQNGTVNAFYSTPSLYTHQKKLTDKTWERRYDDVFPLADSPGHSYWTGYFTSRPALKRQVRFASNALNAARQMEVMSGVKASDVNVSTTRASPKVGSSWTDSFEGSIGVATHHDGMSGTERQDVADDYSARISESHGEVESGITKALQRLMGTSSDLLHCNCNEFGATGCLNVSFCAATTNSDEFTVVAWNGVANEGQLPQLLRLPVNGTNWVVVDKTTGKTLESDVVELDARTLSLPLLYINYFGINPKDLPKVKKSYSNPATHVLVFRVTPPSMGFSSYHVKKGSSSKQARMSPLKPVPLAAAPVTVDNGIYQLTFDPSTGLMTKVTNLKSKVSTNLQITWGWYNSSSDGGCTVDDPSKNPADRCDGQPSGAYMFRPNSSTVFYPGPPTTPTLHVVQGTVVTEVYQRFSSWATHVIRLVKGAPYIEVEWTAGPIPVDTPWLPAHATKTGRLDNWGKEVIIKYTTGLKSKGEFYTDSNGREMVKRTTNGRGPSYPQDFVNHEPIAGNYYPVNAMISLQDSTTEMVVITDVTQGGSSINEGELELMLHRRLQHDDHRGVQEPLNETMCGCNDINAAPGNMGKNGHEGDGGCWCEGLTMRGRHWLVFDEIATAHATRRQLQEQLNFPATLAFANGDVKARITSLSGVSKAMPENIRLMTLTNNYADINEGQLLLRVAHMYAIGEHPTLSQPATVKLSDVFAEAHLKLTGAQAMSLTGNQGIEDMDARKYDWKTADITGGKVDAELSANGTPMTKRFPFDPKDPSLSVTLRPMEVRTFFVTFEFGEITVKSTA